MINCNYRSLEDSRQVWKEDFGLFCWPIYNFVSYL